MHNAGERLKKWLDGPVLLHDFLAQAHAVRAAATYTLSPEL